MPGLLSSTSDIAKILLLGDQGHGKTGAIASLIATGYKLRMINTDNGFKILKALLLDGKHYPYASYMKKAGIDPTEPGRISCITIDVPIDMKDIFIQRKSGSITYNLLGPTSSAAWATVINNLNNWTDPEQNLEEGNVSNFDQDTVLVFDTISTLAELAFFSVQDMNNRLGALEDDHGRDNKAAQDLIDRLAIKLTGSGVSCNVVASTHVKWVDMTRHFAETPSQRARDNRPIDARGWPQIIGSASAPTFGKRWNDVFIVRRDGDTSRATRKIYTAPTNNTDAKNSVWLEDEYPLSTGLAEIFAALRYKDPPTDFINHIKEWNNSQNPNSEAERRQQPRTAFGTFGPR